MNIKLCFIATILLALMFLVGVYVGANRVFPYNQMRWLAESLGEHNPKFSDDQKPGIVIFGDSLTARGEWSEFIEKKDYELLILARGGLRASSYPFKPKEYDGDIHIFWLGTNDLLNNIHLTVAYEALQHLVKQSTDRKKQVILLGIPLPIGISPLKRSEIVKYNTLLEQHCHNNGCTYIDTESILNKQFPVRSKISKDGVHLNLVASRLIASEVKKRCNLIVENMVLNPRTE